MIRYMISPIIGSGTIDDSYRAAVSDVSNVNTASSIPTHESGPNIGQPKYGFCFCVVATASIPAIAAVSNAYVFPDYNLDGRIDGMESEARTGMVQSVEAYNVDGNGLHLVADHADGDSYRAVINAIGQQLQPGFDVNQFTVGEVAS